MLIAAREFLCLSLDDLLVVAREFLNPRLSRSGLHRIFKRREVSICNDPLVSAHLIQLRRDVLGVPHSPETDVNALRCST